MPTGNKDQVMDDKQRILGLLGLSSRAGKVLSGFASVEAGIRKGEIKLLILSEDISANTLGKLLDIAAKTGSDLPDAYSFASSYELGSAIGKPARAVAGITDEGFASGLEAMLQSYDRENETDQHTEDTDQ